MRQSYNLTKAELIKMLNESVGNISPDEEKPHDYEEHVIDNQTYGSLTNIVRRNALVPTEEVITIQAVIRLFEQESDRDLQSFAITLNDALWSYENHQNDLVHSPLYRCCKDTLAKSYKTVMKSVERSLLMLSAKNTLKHIIPQL